MNYDKIVQETIKLILHENKNSPLKDCRIAEILSTKFNTNISTIKIATMLSDCEIQLPNSFERKVLYANPFKLNDKINGLYQTYPVLSNTKSISVPLLPNVKLV